MSTREDFLTALSSLVGGELPLDEADKIVAISLAVKAHSKVKPRQVVVDVTGDGGFDYAISTNLTSWDDEFSSIKSVEYPLDDDDEDVKTLQASDWRVYEKPSGKVLRFLADTPSSSETIRVTYTALHQCDDTTCTVAGFDEEAVQGLAAAFFCDMLSTFYAQSQDSTVMADSVDHSSKSREYAARAKAYRKAYYNHMGIKEGKTPAASVTHDQDVKGSWGFDKLTHPQRYR